MTIEQRRAAFALSKVKPLAGSSDKDKYKTELLKLPARLHTSGLGQTVAFYLSAGKDKPAAIICSWFEDWLRSGEVPVYKQNLSLIEAITSDAADTEIRYRQAAAESRELAVWLKRFAEAFL